MAAAVIKQVERRNHAEDDDENHDPTKGTLDLAEGEECPRRVRLTMEDVQACFEDREVESGSASAQLQAMVSAQGLQKVSQQMWFKGVIACTVVVNTVQLGVEVDHPEFEHLYNVLDHVFTTIFSAEMVTKIFDERVDYFHDGWNLLDCFLVWMSILDCWIFPLFTTGGDSNLRAFSVLRILRVARVVRAVRLLRVFRELWKIVKGILDSTRTMFWSSLLLLLLLYVCSIFCCTMIGRSGAGYASSEEQALRGEELDFFPDYDVYQYFGTVPRSMFTLFETCIEPLNIRPVVERQPWMLAFFIMFIFVTTFGVLNVIIGVIVDHTMASSPEDERIEAMKFLQQDIDKIKRIRTACVGWDSDGNGTVSKEELANAMKRPSVKSFLEDIQMPLGLLPEELFNLLSEGGEEITEADMMRQFTRAVVHTDHQQLLELKIGVHKTQAAQRDLQRSVVGVSSSIDELKEQARRSNSSVEDLHRVMHFSFRQLLSQDSNGSYTLPETIPESVMPHAGVGVSRTPYPPSKITFVDHGAEYPSQDSRLTPADGDGEYSSFWGCCSSDTKDPAGQPPNFAMLDQSSSHDRSRLSPGPPFTQSALASGRPSPSASEPITSSPLDALPVPL